MFHLGIIFLVTYLVGSINFGLILGYIQGLDLRSQGSGNAGATNALRILGTRSGIFVFIGDALKGYLALYVCNLILFQQESLLFSSSDYLFLALIFSEFFWQFSQNLETFCQFLNISVKFWQNSSKVRRTIAKFIEKRG